MNGGHRVLAVLCILLGFSSGPGSADEWSSYLQSRFTASQDTGDYASLRRLKLSGRGQVFGSQEYYIQVLYKTGNRSATDGRVVVQDVSFSRRTRHGCLTIGQFKPPFGLERHTSDAVLALIDRSQATDRLIPNGSLGISFARARGVQFERALSDKAGLCVGIFDGNAANEPLRGNGPLVVGRLAFAPDRQRAGRFRSEIALSWRHNRDIDFSGQLPGAPAGYTHFSGYDSRQNLAFACDTGKDEFRAEYFAARYTSSHHGIPGIAARGFYLQWTHRISRKWAVALRVEGLDPDRGVTNSNDVVWVTTGATLRLHSDRERVQINYVSRSEKTRSIPNDALLVQYQHFL